jgi:murein endopeptidase
MPLASSLATALSAAAALVPTPVLSQCESRAVGEPYGGRLECGRQLPVSTDDLTTWDNALQRRYNRPWRRWGTGRLIGIVEDIAADYRSRYGVRLVVGDLSRTRGGPFGPEFGGQGHASHQNGLDVDIYYPRRDRAELPPFKPADVARRRSQWLVDRAERHADVEFIGSRVGLRRTSKRIQYLANHENHLHLRIRP